MTTVKTLSKPPGIAAIWTAALTRPPVSRSESLPNAAVAVRDQRIDPERSARFDHVMGATASDYVHPGMLHVLAFPVVLAVMANPRFPAPLLGLVHIKNEVLQHRPVRVGETIDIECRVQNLAPHRRGQTFEAVSVVSSGGDIVATDVSTYLSRGTGSHQGPDAGHGERKRSGADGVGRGHGAPAGGAREFGPPPPTARWKLPANTGRVYAGVSGDANPIHMSALSAKAFGFPAAIAHGMYTASRAFSESRPDLSRPLRWDVEFGAPVVLPATVWMNYRDTSAGDGVEYTGYRARRGDKRPRKHFSGTVRHL